MFSEFYPEIDVSHAFCALRLFLCSYCMSLMCSGSRLHVACILPFSRLCFFCVTNDVCEKMAFVVSLLVVECQRNQLQCL